MLSRRSSVKEKEGGEHCHGYEREDREVSNEMNDNSPKKWKEDNKDVERSADPEVNRPVVLGMMSRRYGSNPTRLPLNTKPTRRKTMANMSAPK